MFLQYVSPADDCLLTFAELEILSQTGSTLGILTLVLLTGIVSSSCRCLLLIHYQKIGSSHPGIRKALQLPSLLDLFFLAWYMTLVYTIRFSALGDCKTCRAIYMGVLWMGWTVLSML
ncbi:unnamed protein product [Dibothriocephalus latus]|uniref:Uncharacterized protein n=1 Tax=Dibothriocephalus latus TaxID=60516 RepID=A0A3P7NT62_DIBLA|nr:unnamed protein product [Dibothriocephalus latus]